MGEQPSRRRCDIFCVFVVLLCDTTYQRDIILRLHYNIGTSLEPSGGGMDYLFDGVSWTLVVDSSGSVAMVDHGTGSSRRPWWIMVPTVGWSTVGST